MEKLFYNLSEAEFSKSRKILLWIFASLFFVAGLGVIFMNVILHEKSILISLSAVPFGISFLVGAIAIFASSPKKDHIFSIDDEKIEFKIGLVAKEMETYFWKDISEIHLPHKQKKVRLILKNSPPVEINLAWIEKKKSSHIRKHFYYLAKEKNIQVFTPPVLTP
jgi:hypothetical protein